MPKKKKKSKKVNRSAKTGKFVTKKFADHHPNITVTESMNTQSFSLNVEGKKKK